MTPTRRAVVVALLFAMGCGSGPPTGTTPPPAPTPGAPVSVAIVSGDGQSAAPGSVLPVKLSVLVKDSSGLAVPNVTVHFAVDSGGGSLDLTSVVTSSGGVAGGVTWTLGAVAANNVVSATAGTIAPVRFVATAQSVVLDQMQSTAGGTLTVSRPGNAVDGLQIVVPPSSFATPIHWQVSSRPATDLPAHPGLNPISPLITIHTGVGTYSDSGIMVRIPAQITPGNFAMAFYYDRALGTIEALPLVRSDANSVTIMTRHFSAAALLPAGGGSTGLRAALHGSGIPAVGEVEIVVSQIDPAGLDADISSPFRPAIDGWEINNPSGWAISAGGHCAGWTMTAIWYYYTQRMAVGALFDRYSIDPAIWEDNVRGWRWADLAWGDVNWENYAKVLFPALVAQYTPTPALPATLALNEQRALAYALKVTGMPQYVGLTDALGAGHAVAGYRVANNRVYYADPAQPGIEVSAAFDANFPASGATWKYQMMAGVSSFVPFDKIAARWQTFQAGTIGNAEYPAMVIERAVVTGTDTAWVTVADTMWTPERTARLRVRCPSCPPFAGGLGDASRSFKQSNAGVTFATTVPIPFTRDADFKPVFGTTPPYHEEYTVTVSGAVGHIGMTVSGIRAAANQGGWGMVDFRQITMIYNQASIVPAVPVQTPGTPLSLSFQVAQNLLPPHVKYVWDFGDQQPAVTVTVVDTPTVQHTYTALGSYPITAKIIDVRNNQVIGKATTAAAITEKWSLVTFQQVSLTGDPAYPAAIWETRTSSELRDSILARPAGATVQLFHGGVALPQGLHELGDILVRADVDVTAPSMFLSFPRGQPAGGLLAEAVAATGAASSANLIGPLCLVCYPVVFTNAITLGGTPGAFTYAGKAGNWVVPMPNSRVCSLAGQPTPDPRGKSPVVEYLEINATQGSSGMQGTITFVTVVVNQNVASICAWDIQ